MKLLFFSLISVASISFVACNNTSDKSPEIKTPAPVATQSNVVEAKKPTVLARVITHYLHLKNALIADDGKAAATASQEMAKALAAIDKTSFTAEQQKVFAENQDDLAEHAGHIGMTKDIEHQREHFSAMSEDVFALTKVFGSGQTLYQDNCPMFNDKKGAIWLSEVAEIKNPYYGSKMPTCGKMIQEVK